MSPWVRIDENAMAHPKIGALSDGAFRLWVQALAYCQTYLTDGVVSRVALSGLRACSQKRKGDLIAAGLWHASDDGGITVHDFLEWNDSRTRVLAARTQARERVQKFRGSRLSNAVTERVCNAVTEPVCNGVRSPNVPSGVLCSSVSELALEKERGVGKTTSERAGAFCEWYADTHERLFSVGYLGNPQTDYQTALRLCDKFTDPQLQDATMVWFGMEDTFAVNGTRTIAKFASRASNCLLRVKASGIA